MTILALNFISVDQAKIALGGRLEQFIANWSKITSDKIILNHNLGYKIDFVNLPSQECEPAEIKLSKSEEQILDMKIQEMLQKNAVVIVV